MQPAAVGIAYYMWISRRRGLKALFLIALLCYIVAVCISDELIRAMAIGFAVISLFNCCVAIALPYEGLLPQGGYPRVLLRLPLPTWTLVFWPWIFGTIGLSMMWVTLASIVNFVGGERLSLSVPCLGIAVWISCFQAALWAPFRNPGIKILARITGLVAPFALMQRLLVSELSEYTIAAILSGLLPVTYLTAIAGLAHYRRGDTWPMARPWVRTLAHYRRRAPAVKPAFTSPFLALRWYFSYNPVTLGESNSGAVQILTYICLLFGLRTTKGIDLHLVFLGLCLVTPLAFALIPSLVETKVRGLGYRFTIRESMNFVLLRPTSSCIVAAAFFRSNLLSTAWFFFYLSAMAALAWFGWSTVSSMSGYGPVGLDLLDFFARFPAWQSAALIGLLFLILVVLSWRVQTDKLIPGLPGRYHRFSYLASLSLLASQYGFVTLGISFLLDPSTRTSAITILSLLGLAILAVKLLVALLAFREALAKGMVDGLLIRELLVIWIVVTSLSLALGSLALSGDWLPMPAALLLLWGAILMPLARFALIPIALELSRHR